VALRNITFSTFIHDVRQAFNNGDMLVLF